MTDRMAHWLTCWLTHTSWVTYWVHWFCNAAYYPIHCLFNQQTSLVLYDGPLTDTPGFFFVCAFFRFTLHLFLSVFFRFTLRSMSCTHTCRHGEVATATPCPQPKWQFRLSTSLKRPLRYWHLTPLQAKVESIVRRFNSGIEHHCKLNWKALQEHLTLMIKLRTETLMLQLATKEFILGSKE